MIVPTEAQKEEKKGDLFNCVWIEPGREISRRRGGVGEDRRGRRPEAAESSSSTRPRLSDQSLNALSLARVAFRAAQRSGRPLPLAAARFFISFRPPAG